MYKPWNISFTFNYIWKSEIGLIIYDIGYFKYNHTKKKLIHP